MLGQPMVTLWQNVLESEAKSPTVNHKSPHKGPFDLQERIVKAWRAVLACVQSRYGAPFTSDLLDALSPLLVLCLSCKRQDVVSETLTFWTATFDLAPEPLVYPNKLRDVLVKCRKKWDLQLKLPGFEQTSGAVAHSTVEDSLPHTDSSRHLPSQSAPADEPSPHNSGVILPHPSPQRGVRGSFLGQKRSPRPGVPTTPPRSPAAQDMEEILARSRGHGGRGGAGVAKSPVLSARRRLSLNSDKPEDYVLVEPPAKRQQLLTEHQRERMRERRESIPVMYNALDPSQEPTQFTAQPDSAPDEPVIIPESEGSPPTTVTARSIFATSSEPRPPPVSSSISSLVQGPSSSVRPRAHSQTFSHQLGSAPINSNASVSTNQVASSGMEACRMVSGIHQGHVRKSPISSRTRSRARPEEFSTAPSGNGTPYPVALNAPPYYSVSRPFVPHSATGSMMPVRLAYHPLPSSSPTLPASTHQLPSTSIHPPFSPTDQHYQTVHGGPRFPAIGTEPQQVYQLIQSGTGHPVMFPVPLRQPVITEAHPSSTSGPQFVPVIPQSIAAGPVAPTTSIAPGVSSQQDPIFPPARYIFRPGTNPPHPYSLHSAPETSLPPLPLSAVIRPDLSATRRANKQHSSTHIPYLLPAVHRRHLAVQTGY
ncbi:Telomere-associated protein RIF1 [Geodia barretti]|uniref:Telomere-associated protein RIF1 n=1 Tax=Geodia barretti TaxID=519541 RepID=A0AA35QVW7_GEOBA|nr:Telomere-associated protein RIF1 [Geodia barretti]